MTSDPVRAEALALWARLVSDARQLGAPHVLAYLEAHQDEFVEAYAATRSGRDTADPISPFLYTLT